METETVMITEGVQTPTIISDATTSRHTMHSNEAAAENEGNLKLFRSFILKGIGHEGAGGRNRPNVWFWFRCFRWIFEHSLSVSV